MTKTYVRIIIASCGTSKGVLYLNLFSEFITNFYNKTVRAYIFHKIYGNQSGVIRDLKPFVAEDRVGFYINDREVFVYFDEIESAELNGNEFIINGTLQKMVVKLI